MSSRLILQKYGVPEEIMEKCKLIVKSLESLIGEEFSESSPLTPLALALNHYPNTKYYSRKTIAKAIPQLSLAQKYPEQITGEGLSVLTKQALLDYAIIARSASRRSDDTIGYRMSYLLLYNILNLE